MYKKLPDPRLGSRSTRSPWSPPPWQILDPPQLYRALYPKRLGAPWRNYQHCVTITLVKMHTLRPANAGIHDAQRVMCMGVAQLHGNEGGAGIPQQ